jgi:putative nucleotidyltransferase with HDIG domain
LEIANKILRSIDDFPTLPTIFTTLSDVMANPRSTPSDAADVISRDQSSVGKILRAANSSIYGFRKRIDSVTQAIFYIGFDEVKNLILAMSILDIFKKFKISLHYNPIELWKHSIAVGVITRLIGKTIGVKNLENFFVTGILHDIGKLLFLRNISEEYAKTIDYARDNKITIREAEAETLGITHTVAGDLIAEKWKLPQNIRYAIKYHYIGSVNNNPDLLTGSVHLADVAARFFELGDPGDNIVPEPNFEIWNYINLPDNFFSSMIQKIMLDYEESVLLFSLK